MAYCTNQDLIDRFTEAALVELTDADRANDVNQDAIDQAIADADGQIDRKLRGRYTVPVTPVPPELVDIACDLTFYNLYRGKATPDETQRRYEAAMKELRDYATGINVLPVASTETPPQRAVVIGPAEVFTDEVMGMMG